MSSAHENSHGPLILAFASDLMLTTKIENVARLLGYRVILIGSVEDIAPEVNVGPENQAAEPVFGRDALMVDKITSWQPSLLIFDLGNEAVPWQNWMSILKSSPATRRIPVLAFGPHVDVERLKAARALDAAAVVARSRFMSALPDLIQRYARVPDLEGLALACRKPLSKLALQGLEAFNQGDFYESHELLEDAWNEDSGPARDLYRAVLQVAVAYLQIERGNYMGAVKMFLRVRQWLKPLPDVCRGINVSQLRDDVQVAHAELLELGLDNIGAFDRNLFRPVSFTV